MQKEVRLLVSAVVVALFSLTMFAAAIFFYNNLREIYHACAEFGMNRHESFRSESVAVSITSIKAGIAWFSGIGLASWMVAVYLAVKCRQAFVMSRLP